MTVFQVRQRATGAILWTGVAENALAAFDAMAHEAGYYDLPEHVRAEGLVADAVRV